MRPLIAHLDTTDLEWRAQGTHGIRSKLLSEDPETQGKTLYIDIPPKWQGGGVAHYHDASEEVFIIEGDVTLVDGRDWLLGGSYLYRPAGIVHGHDERADRGNRSIIKAGGPLELILVHDPASEDEYILFPADDGRPHVLNLKTQDMEWKSIGEGQAQHGVKRLTEDASTGATTSLVRLPPDWAGASTMSGDTAWEWFILSGEAALGDGTAFGESTYSFRPPGSPDVAFSRSGAGCEMLLWRGA
jgi:quercetin dioxygenase-like cupin family protein